MEDLAEIRNCFVTHWGEMGARWGVDHPVAKLHAFLYLSPVALSVDRLSEELKMETAEVQSALNELVQWKLARSTDSAGAPPTYRAEQDVFTMLQLIADQRKKKELDPTVSILREIKQRLQALESSEERLAMERGVGELLEFLESVSSLYDRGKKMPLSLIKKLLKLDQKLEKLLNFL